MENPLSYQLSAFSLQQFQSFKFRVSSFVPCRENRTPSHARNLKPETRNRVLEPAVSFVLVAESAVYADRTWLLRTRYRVSVLVNLHTEAQAHRGKDLLDLVERLAAEILGLEHFGFGLLHEFTDGLDIGILQAVVAAHGEVQCLDRAVHVLVADLGLALVNGRRGLDLLFKVDEDVHVVLQQLRSKTERVRRCDRTVRPDLERQLVIIGNLTKTRCFHRVIALTHR